MRPMSNGRSVGTIAAVIVGLMAVAVVIVLVADRRAPQAFPPGSPEAAIQAYLQAFEDREVETAYEHFSAAAQKRMTLQEFEEAANGWHASQGVELTHLVLIAGSTIDGSRATVELIVESTYEGGLENNTYREEREALLTLEDGAWRFVDPLVWLDPFEYYSFK